MCLRITPRSATIDKTAGICTERLWQPYLKIYQIIKQLNVVFQIRQHSDS